jgi:nicotinamidase-related amidase/type 1 glutamine amidotransferase
MMAFDTSRRVITGTVTLSVLAACFSTIAADDSVSLNLRLRTRAAVSPESGQYRAVSKTAAWKASETAIVICDMWNNHYCRNAARRVAEMAPRMNEVVKRARQQGVLIIHSPSGCMDQYADTPQRKLAQQAPRVETKIPLQGWCYLDDKHETAMPVSVEQPCDDDGAIRPRVRFFQRQIDTLEIADGDAITDSAEAFYLMKQRGIRNIIIMGVHTNMCVLGRPFGIRQMIYQGQNVALMRDMTDTMYNPRDEPFVNHFTGNDLVFEHIERFWCPTITSADILGNKPFRFPGDRRKHVVVVMAEDGYDTSRTLPSFAVKHLGPDFKVSFVFANSANRNDIPGIEILDDADLAIWSIRRRTLPQKQLDVFQQFIAAGKPLVAIRTSSHGFSLSKGSPPAGLVAWPEFDQQVLGGNYNGDHNNKSGVLVTAAEGVSGHPILTGVRTDKFTAAASLYKTSPLADTVAPLLIGRADGVEQSEPVAWTHQRPNGGRVFYTSLGHRDDFSHKDFQLLLRNAIYWAASLPVPETATEVAAGSGC